MGRDFLPRAKSIVSEMTMAVERLKDMSRYARGSFTLACVPSMLAQALSPLIRRYAEAYLGNRIRIIDTNAFEVRDAVLHGQAELGVGIPTDHHPDLDETLLMEDPLMFFCREEHPLSKMESVTWSDVHEAELIVVSSMTATSVFMGYQLAERGISLSGAYEVLHHATALSLVAAGVGTAILPASTSQDGSRPGLCCIPLTGPVVKRRVAVLTRRNATLSPAARAFFDILKQSASVMV
ncbi:MAG: LysR substrate-binding domain-containing protein [Lautropia sp.]|nr:LysR substrate-binding domain-containing protein [Lautropia sp.]